MRNYTHSAYNTSQQLSQYPVYMNVYKLSLLLFKLKYFPNMKYQLKQLTRWNLKHLWQKSSQWLR